ncbi:catalytic, putative [Fagus crenata]
MDQYQQAIMPNYECLLFDLDDTLYPLSTGFWTICTENIEEYMVKKLGIDEKKVLEISPILYKTYGTTMAGLRAIGHDFDYDDYHSFVHGRLPYDILKPDHVLRNLLLSLPIRKVIFSNSDEAHVKKVLSKLGLEDCFEMIICFESLNPTKKKNIDDNINIEDVPSQPNGNSELLAPKSWIICKPLENAFEQAFKIASINPKKTLFFDDSTRNIQTGNRMGLDTVLVGKTHRTNGADYALESIHNMREALPMLWEDINKSGNISSPRKVAIETSVVA